MPKRSHAASDPTAAHRMARYRSRARRRALRRVEFLVPKELVPTVRRLVADLVATRRDLYGTRDADAAPINAEEVNDLAKLLLHRRIVEQLAHQPQFVEAARHVVENWPRDTAYADEWRQVLREPLPEISRRLTDPGECGRRLRNSSPFAALPGLALTDPEARRRLWRLAKQTLEQSTIMSARSVR